MGLCSLPAIYVGPNYDVPGCSDCKALPTMWETWVQSLGWEDLLEKEMATHSSVLAWKTPRAEEPGGLQSKGLQRVGSDWVTSLNYGGSNEDNGDLLQKVPCRYCCTLCLWPWRRPPLTHTSAGDSWTLMGKSGSVSCGVTAPLSWILVQTMFCLCPPRVCFPSPL